MAANFKFGMGRCCCPACQIATSLFDDSTGITTTGSVSGGLLTLDVNEVMTFDTSAASDDDATHLITYADTSAATATVRLILAYTDASNYLFGEFAVSGGAGTIRVGERVSGNDSYLSAAVTITDVTTDLGNRHEMILCWAPGAPQTPTQTAIETLGDSAGGTGWSDVANAIQKDGSNALYAMGGAPPVVSDVLAVLFSVPTIPRMSTIDGFAVDVTCGHDGTSTDVSLDVLLEIDTDSGTKTGTAISSGSADYLHGGSADLWGMSVTADSINATATATVSLTFTDSDTGTAQLTVDAVRLLIYFTTPDRDRGTLIFRLKNNGSGLYSCAKATAVYASGLKAGLRAQVDTWDFTEATYSYQQSATRPSCPACSCTSVDGQPCGCCTTPPPYNEYILDFGAGGWTDDECGGCDGLSGQYTVTGNGACGWVYVEPFVCTCDTHEFAEVEVSLILADIDGGGCRWVAMIGFRGGTVDPTDQCRPSYVIYHSAVLAAATDCQGVPVTLNKFFEQSGMSALDMCDGTMPATITLDV